MRRFPLALTFGVLLATSACQPSAPEAPTETLDASETAPTPELSPEQANALAFRAAWDSAAPATASDPNPESEVPGSFEFTDSTVQPLGAGLYALISTGVGDNGAGAVAIHYLVRTPDGFRRNEVEPLFISAGSGGEPQWTLRSDLTPVPAVLVSARSTGQGRTCQIGSLVELTPSHPVLRADEMRLRVSDADGAESAALEGQLAPGRVGGNFTLTFSGASDAVVTYVLTDLGTYRPMGEPNSLPGC